MSTYSLSGSGTHALTASTTGLHVTITTPSSVGGSGRSNPVAKYDQGLIRFSDGTGYWSPVPILGGPQFIPVPANATSIGYALIGGAVVSVTEVIGGTVFFSGGASSLASLTDVDLSGAADGQVLEYIAGAAKWEPRTPAAGSVSPLIAVVSLTAAAASIHFAAIPGTFSVLVLMAGLRASAAAQTVINLQINSDATLAHYASNQGGASSQRIGVVYGSTFGAALFSMYELALPNYASGSITAKNVHANTTIRPDGTFEPNGLIWTPSAAAAITDLVLSPSTSTFAAGSWAALLGY